MVIDGNAEISLKDDSLMLLIRDKRRFLKLCFTSIIALGAVLIIYSISDFANPSGGKLKVSNLLVDHAWDEALRTGRSNHKAFSISKKTKTVFSHDASVLDGISGESQVHTDEIPVARYKGAVVPADTARRQELLKNVLAGDIIRIVNTDGKAFYYQVIRSRSGNKDKMCGDLRTSQKDTRLADCELGKNKELAEGRFILRKLPAPEVEDLLKKDAKAEHQS